MNKKKILIASANFFTIERFRMGLISELLDNGYKVVLLSTVDQMSKDSYRALCKLGIECVNTKLSRGSFSIVEAVKYLFIYMKIIREHKIDLVINFTIFPMIIGGLACRIFQKKFISVITGLGSQFNQSKLKYILFSVLYFFTVKHSEQVWFVSRSDLISGSSILKIPEEKKRIVYGSGVPIVNKISKSFDSLDILYMGRIRKDKGVEDFLGLSNKFCKDKSKNFLMMGSYDTNDSVLISKILDCKKKGCVRLQKFDIDNLAYLQSSNVVLMCSRHEGMPTILLEAMSYNSIPVSSNIPVANELVSMGAEIFIYEQNNLNDLFKTIEEISKLTEEKITRILSKNYEFVKSNFSQGIVSKIQFKYLESVFKIE